MKTYLAAIGEGGARIAEAVVWTAMANMWPADSLRILLIGAHPEEDAGAHRLVQDYMTLHTLCATAEKPVLQTAVTLRHWPEDKEGQQLRSFCTNETDRLLLRTLFPAAAADSGDLGGYAPTVALNWERLLWEKKEDELSEMAKEADTAQVILCGSLCDAVCAAGIRALMRWLREQNPACKPLLVLQLAISDTDNDGLAKASLPLIDADPARMALIALPQDCREQRTGGHIADWLAAYAMRRLLLGEEGPFSFRLPLGPESWAMFDAGDTAWQRSWESLMRTAYLALMDYIPVTLHLIDSKNPFRSRGNAWFTQLYRRKGKLTAEDRERQKEELRTLRRLFTSLVRWMQQTQDSLPAPLRFAEELSGSYEAAREHYMALLRKAGDLTQLRYDIKQGGLDEGMPIQRHQTGESEAERALRQSEEMQKELVALQMDQRAKDAEIGGRLRRILLEDAVAQTREEADTVRAQLKAAEEKIREAEEIAKEDELPQIAIARSSLQKLAHHLIALDGRHAWAQQDLKKAMQDESRLNPPKMAEGRRLVSGGLFSGRMLARLIELERATPHETKNLLAELEPMWFWPGVSRERVGEQIAAQQEGEDGLSPTGVLMRRILLCCRRQPDETEVDR